MSAWRQWWRWWLAANLPTRRPLAEEQPDGEHAERMSPGRAAAILQHPAAGHPANASRAAEAAQRLQQQLGNHGVQLLVEDEGEPLPPCLRIDLGSEPGEDLDDVRLHTGAAGAEIARAAGAEGVTVGKDIALAEDAYAPETPHGRQLLAHELAHTVQAGLHEGASTSALEAEARGGRPARGAAGVAQVLREPKKSWADRVKEAQAESDADARRTALIALVTEALDGFTLHIVAATPSSGPVATDQYKPAPAINFDFNLENKEYWPGAGRKGKLGPRTGYFFSDGGKGYAIIGPGALEATTSALTRMYAGHELFHAAHHIGVGLRDDQELEAWTNDFVSNFHQVYQARKSWKPLIDYYEGASESARKAALKALVDYYNGQPEDIQRVFWNWLKRRQQDMADKQLVKDLVAALPAPAKTMVKAPPKTPPPK